MKKKIEQLAKQNDKLLTRSEKEILNNYIKHYNRIDKEIARLYKKYGDKDGKVYLEQLVKYDRLSKLDNQVAVILASMYNNNNKMTRQVLRNIMKVSYNTITKEVAVRSILKEVKITEEVNKLVAGINWRDRNNNHKANLIYKAHGVIRDGLESGKTYTSMANDIKELLGKDIANPIRIARTEGHRIMESGKYEAVQDLEGKGMTFTKTWLSSQDERVRSTHQAMNDVTIPIDEDFKLPSGVKTSGPTMSGVASEDINCRCILVYTPKRIK